MTRPMRATVEEFVTSCAVLRLRPDADDGAAYDAIEKGLTGLGRVPLRYQTAEVDNPTVAAWVETVLVRATRRPIPNILTGPSLLILGGTGAGKTHQAYGAIRQLAVSGAYFSWQATTAADLYVSLRPRGSVDHEAHFRSIANARLLLLDDLGAAKSSEWTEEQTYRLINYRYEHELPTLITSNVEPRRMAVDLGERVASRLNEMCSRVVLDGPDRRRTKGAAA